MPKEPNDPQMITRCPNCETIYDIDENTLASVDYTAVCCQCHQVFNAKNSVVSDESVTSPPAAYALKQPSVPVDDWPGSGVENDTRPTTEPWEDGRVFGQRGGINKNRKAAPSQPPDVPEDFSSLAAAELPAHQFSKPQKPKSKPGPLVAAGVLILALVAIAQLAWINKEQLLEHPQGRQLVQMVCNLGACELEQQKAIDKFVILHRNLQPSVSHPNAFSFTLSFANDADFSQQPPMLQLSLLDHKDLLLAQRRFSPDEYLYPASAEGRSIRPQEIVNVELLLLDQALKISSFTLEIL